MKYLTVTPATNVAQNLRLYESAPGYAEPDTEHLVTFRDLLRILRFRWKAILLSAAAVAALSMAVMTLITPTYIGAALVMVDQQRNRIFNEQNDPSVLSNLPSDPTAIENQVQMLQSHVLAGQVVDKLNLVSDPEFNGTQFDLAAKAMAFAPGLVRSFAPGLDSIFGFGTANQARDSSASGQQQREMAITKLLGGLDVHVVGLSTAIAVNFRSTSATKAARIANAIAATHIENLSAAKSGASEGASKWLADRVGQLAQRASAADAAVQQYKAENDLVDTSNGTAITDQQLGALTAQLVQAEGDEAQARAKLSRVQQLVRAGHGADATDVVDSPLIGQLREQEATLLQQEADLSSRYGPLHPSMLNVEARIRELRSKINEEVNRIVGTATNDVNVAAVRVGTVKSNMAAATSHTAAQNRARIKLVELQANATSERALYQSYLDRLKQTQQQASMVTPDVHLVSPASVPLAPVSPKKLLIVAGATSASLVLGFLAALISDRMCAGFRSKQEMETKLCLPVLATIPELQTWRRSLKEVVLQGLRNPRSHFSEAIRGLEISLSFHAARKPKNETGRAVLVTSALPAEGKTTTAVSLARRLAASGQTVVVIDADLRRPGVATALGLQNIRYGLSDYLMQRCSLDEVLVQDPRSTLMALPATQAADAAELIRSPAMTSLLERLRQIADFIVIDSPPVLAVSDARLLAQITDGTVMVVRWEKTPQEAALQAVNLLREFRTKLIGAALARANAKQHQIYSFGYTGVPALADYYES